jgi:hypothetical protein
VRRLRDLRHRRMYIGRFSADGVAALQGVIATMDDSTLFPIYIYIYIDTHTHTRRQLAREHLPHPRCKGVNVRCTSELL